MDVTGSFRAATTLSWAHPVGRYVSLRASLDAVTKETRYKQGTRTRVCDWRNCGLSSVTFQLVIRFVNEGTSV
jgi:hypothetical protein